MSDNESHGSPTRGDQHQNNDDDDDAMANNSIIGKVKSRVSSIFPNSLSKWFSPSTKDVNISSRNGSVRRRRRYEDDDVDQDDVVDQDDENVIGIDCKRRRGRSAGLGGYASKTDDNDVDNSDDSNNSKEDVAGRIVVSATVHHQPPSKRSRLNADDTTTTNTYNRYSFLSSTPTVSSLSLLTESKTRETITSRTSRNRNKYLNLYGTHTQKQPAYNFTSSKTVETTSSNYRAFGNPPAASSSKSFAGADIIDLVPEEALGDSAFDYQSRISSRRSLNIPSTSSESYSSGLTNLKRQSLSSVKTTLPYVSRKNSNALGALPMRTSTTIYEIEDRGEDTDDNHNDNGQRQDSIVNATAKARNDNEDNEEEENCEDENDNDEEQDDDDVVEILDDNLTNTKKRKITNGKSAAMGVRGGGSLMGDTASESSDSCRGAFGIRQKGGLFRSGKSTATGTRNSSCTSSMGNGLNFYSHLEGRKSLFSEKNMRSNLLNNSTLSLTSLNRRHFNSSLYGSTSALSDSRLLNTLSPFYKGKTTYGGAAAYNKFASSRTSSAAIRITPTLIRPTSSLSTLSSSNNSLAHHEFGGGGGGVTTISNTAKRILELINDFPTPLNDARKMASSLRMNTASKIQQNRFSDADLSASRSTRLMNVRSPYKRPAVILNPTNSINKQQLPPVKELQVPSMSQLLQMKRLQSTTERSRQIAKSRPSNVEEYKLPPTHDKATSATAVNNNNSNNNTNKHVSKIKNKITNTGRVSSIKAAANTVDDEEAPLPANLPTIAFPFMASVPKFDIDIPSSNKQTAVAVAKNDFVGDNSKSSSQRVKPFAFDSSTDSKNKDNSSSTSGRVSKAPSAITNSFSFASAGGSSTASAAVATTFAFTTSSTSAGALAAPASTTLSNFIFSSPLSLPIPDAIISPINGSYYKFSAPIIVGNQEVSESSSAPYKNTLISIMPPTTATSVPQLKTGSVLDALKKPFCSNSSTSSKATTTISSNATPAEVSSLFGSQFKKASNEWECSVCMIRNKDTLNACAACTTPRKSGSGGAVKPLVTAVPAPAPSIKNSFGDAFKPKANTWECSTCMIMNKNDAMECVACNAKKPSAAVTAVTAACDDSFKSIAAAQSVAKWECPACMTRNDASRNKCVCCEQAKPGAQVVSESVPKFSFGASSASKFSFGFGTESGASKEEELRHNPKETATMKKLSDKTETTSMTQTQQPAKLSFGFSSNTNNSADTVSGPSASGFVFGSKSSASANSGKDVADSSTSSSTGFKFGVVNQTDDATNKITAAPTGFVFGSVSQQPTATASAGGVSSSNSPAVSKQNETSTSSSSSVKFNLPAAVVASSEESAKKISMTASATAPAPAATFAFGSSAVVSSGFKPSVGGTGSGGFAFGNATVADSKSVETSHSAFTAKTTAASTAASAATATKSPSFTFGNATKSGGMTSLFGVTTSTAKTDTQTVSGGFSFGGAAQSAAISSSATATTTTTTNSLFGSAISSSASTTVSSSTPTNVFGSTLTTVFGSKTVASATNNEGGPSQLPSFGSAASSTSSMLSTGIPVFGAASSSSTFGSFGNAASSSAKSSPASATSTSNIFGAFSAPTEKPPAAVFGSVSTASKAPFTFGSSSLAAASSVAAASSPSSSTSAASTTSWPKNSFVFGSSAKPLDSSANQKPAVTAASMFGAFSAPQSSNANPTTQATPIFGQSSSISANAFGSSATATPVFGSGTASAAGGLFGSHSTGVGAATLPAFGGGAMSFSGTASTAGTFGNTETFGSFSAFPAPAAAPLIGSSTSSDGPSAPKKSEPAFNFGAAAAVQNAPSSGFSFGTPANNANTGASLSGVKPASFNFGSSSAATPTFNFTGSAGATQSAPFQFNAGTPPTVSSNIFAPTPTPGSQTAGQQARRKIRPPIRRMTPR